jgi:hypothetical protein
MKTKMTKIDETCANCGYPMSGHYAVNFSDVPYVSGTVLICPTGVYSPVVEKKPRKR